MPNPQDQRKAPRKHVDIDADIYILAPEETFSASPFRGKIIDLSNVGLGVAIPGMPRTMFQRLLRGERLARVVAKLPGNDTESRLFGNVAWIDFRETDSPPTCRLGISVEKTPDKICRDLQRAVDFLARQLPEVASVPV